MCSSDLFPSHDRAGVEELIEDCRNGKVSNVLFIDTLKDERRDNAKVDAGKTRWMGKEEKYDFESMAAKQYLL